MGHTCLSRLALIAALVPAPLWAQDIIELDDIVISANLTPTDAARSGVSASVVTEEELDAAGTTNLAAVLATLPGVSVTTSGPMGNTANLRIRGADRRYIAVYIDGIRVTDPTMTETAFEFGAMSTADIGRIELLRGSQSALYGGTAVGGVINITTRAAMEDGFSQSAAVEAGSFGTVSGRYTLANRTERSETAFTLSHLRSDGFSAVDGGTEDDGIETSRLSFSTRYRLSETVTVGGAAFAQRTRQEFDGYDSSFMLADMDNVQHRREAGARLFAEIETGNSLHMVEATAYRVRRTFDEEGAISRFSGSRLGFGYRGTTDLSPALTLVYGAETMEERARYTALPGGSRSTRINGAFGQALWAPRADLDIAASVRVDHNSDFGSFTSGRLAAAWRPSDDVTLRAVLATGFRPPSLDERFGDYPGSFPFIGNPDLTPEKSRSFELGIEKRFANGATISATAFALRIDNLITYTFGIPVSTMANLPGRSKRQGLELAASLPLGDRVTLGAGYTYLQAQRPDGVRLALVPRHDLRLSLEAELTDRLRAAVSAQHMAGRLDDFSAGPMPDFTVVNASVAYDLGRGAEAYLRVENLFDRQYQLSQGYATSDRAIYVGLRARF
ncbi:MAG: TonB-dependent receptor [Gemmobacter sp.]